MGGDEQRVRWRAPVIEELDIAQAQGSVDSSGGDSDDQGIDDFNGTGNDGVS